MANTISTFFPGFETFDVPISSDITIHGVRSGTGPPLLLLHGFPQTHVIWHVVAPQLTEKFTVICMDLPGYGQSSKPLSTAEENHKPYAKSTLAANLVAAMDALGFTGKFGLVGHDRGGRVAHKMCVDFPQRVDKCMVLDIAPTLAMFEQTDQGFATDYWHWFFLIQPYPFPEQLIMKNLEIFGERFFRGRALGGGGGITEKAMGEYVGQFKEEASVHGMCEDYRAGAGVDCEEARGDQKEGRKVRCPLRCLWGKQGVVEKRFDALKEWRAVCEGSVSGEAVDCGHYIPEEKPDEVVRHVLDFFA